MPHQMLEKLASVTKTDKLLQDLDEAHLLIEVAFFTLITISMCIQFMGKQTDWLVLTATFRSLNLYKHGV